MTLPQRVALQDWFSQSGLQDLHHLRGHYAYAKRLARYISDPSTVRVRTLEMFGNAPGIEAIRKMREEWMAVVRHRAEKSYSYGLRSYEMKPRIEPKRKPRLEPKPVPVQVAAPTPEPEPVVELVAPLKHYNLLTVSDVIDAAADICGVSYGEIIGTMRTREVVRARNLAATVLRARGSSASQVGRRLGRDHTTILNSLGKFFDRDMREKRIRDGWLMLAPERAKHVRSLEELYEVLGV